MPIIVKSIPLFMRILIFSLGVALTVGIGFSHYMLQVDLTLSFFFLFPLIMVTWFTGIWAGAVIAVISAVAWIPGDLQEAGIQTNFYLLAINEFFRLFVFLFIVIILSKLHELIQVQQELASTDYLTGIANRRAFFTLADAEIKRSRRYQQPFSIAYIDLDNFKYINDLYGHGTGDDLLREVASTIRRNIREVDIPARLGGDEFVLLLPETSARSARAVMKKIRDNLLSSMKEREWPVTFSIGLVTFNTPPATVSELILTSDNLMYKAKQSGKNRIRNMVKR